MTRMLEYLEVCPWPLPVIEYRPKAGNAQQYYGLPRPPGCGTLEKYSVHNPTPFRQEKASRPSRATAAKVKYGITSETRRLTQSVGEPCSRARAKPS